MTLETLPKLDSAAICRRAVDATLSIRAGADGVADDGVVPFVGYASVTGRPYEVFDWYGLYDEEVEMGAFAEVLLDDTRLLINHDPSLIVARVPAGNLRLSEDKKGLKVEADLPTQISYVADMVENIRLGNLTQMSFAFTVASERWEWAKEKDERDKRVITRIGNLYDVSIVTYPANPNTDAGLRTSAESALEGVLRAGVFTDDEVVAFCRKLATSSPSGDAPLTFGDHADRLIGSIQGFARRASGLVTKRAEEGGRLSDEHTARLAKLRDLLDGLSVAARATGDRTMNTRMALQEEQGLADMFGLSA